MSRKLLRFGDYIQRLVKFASLKAYQRILGLILLALLVLITTLYIPAVLAQRVEESSQVNSQTSNAQLLLQQGLELYDAEQFSEAIGVFRQAASAFVNQGNSLNQALVLRYLSLAYQHLGELQEAENAIADS
ncbi:MAG: hypothetical protein AB1861_24030, partial [Cyanobacteriota bacterium]